MTGRRNGVSRNLSIFKIAIRMCTLSDSKLAERTQIQKNNTDNGLIF